MPIGRGSRWAKTERVENLPIEVDELLYVIAKYLIEPDGLAGEWVESTFVSDESTIGHFLMEKDIEPLKNDLGLFTLSGRDLICDVAESMRKMKTRH